MAIALLKSASAAAGLFSARAHHAAAEIGGRIVRVERERLVVVGERQVELIGFAVDQPAVGVGLRVFRIDADRLVEIGERLGVAAGFAEHRAAHVVGLRVLRIALHHLGQRGDIGGRGGKHRVLAFRAEGGGADAGKARASAERERDERERGERRNGVTMGACLNAHRALAVTGLASCDGLASQSDGKCGEGSALHGFYGSARCATKQ